jgi:transcriptional regulator with XRE-family HTH domain
MHRNYVGAIERGDINQTYVTLLRLSAGLNLPIEHAQQELPEDALA